MTIIDQKGWDMFVNKNSDPYGKAIVQYAQTWADLMEQRILNGEPLTAVASETSIQADTEGITGNMFFGAVFLLSSCWRYGEDLRDWHNRSYDYQGSGVLNPSVLIVK